MFVWIWVLIPLAGIAMGGFSEWLKFKEKQAQLGLSVEKNSVEMLQTIKEMQEQQAQVVKRLENLEMIVTSEEWDLRDANKAMGTPLLSIPEEEPTPAEKTARIARRIRN